VATGPTTSLTHHLIRRTLSTGGRRLRNRLRGKD